MRLDILGIIVAAVGVLMLLACVAFGILSVWTGDDRWQSTALVLMMPGFIIGAVGVAVLVEAKG